MFISHVKTLIVINVNFSLNFQALQNMNSCHGLNFVRLRLSTHSLELAEAIHFFRKYSKDYWSSINHFVKFSGEYYQQNSLTFSCNYVKRILFILQGLEAYQKYMIDMALYVRGDNDREEVTRQMKDVLNFEKKMANVSTISLSLLSLFNIEIPHGAGSLNLLTALCFDDVTSHSIFLIIKSLCK